MSERWPASWTMQTVTGPIAGTVRPPGSKSISNRALLLATLASGVSNLRGLADCEDTRLMATALTCCGAEVSGDWDTGDLQITGLAADWLPATKGKRTPGTVELFVGNSGTTIRFLTAALAARGGNYRLSGVPRMHERPIQDLVEALTGLGANLTYEQTEGYPPVVIQSIGLRGGIVDVKGDRSSQYLSGLMMAAPLARETVRLRIEGRLVSRPYVEMTMTLMNRFGVQVHEQADRNEFLIEPQTYRSRDLEIEPDASGASYFFAAAAICGGQIRVQGLNRQSLQGDLGFLDCLQRMGCKVEWQSDAVTVIGGKLQGIDCDMSNISDTTQTLAVVSLFAQGPTRIRGVAHNRLKETDRIGNLAAELRKVGAAVVEHEDGLTIVPQPLKPATLSTWNDHRMAMSLALIGLRQPGIVIENPGCVVKTYPNYFRDLERVVGVKARR